MQTGEKKQVAEYVVDASGKRTRVIIPVEVFERLVSDAEDLADLRVALEARAKMERGEAEFVSWEEVKDTIGSEYEPEPENDSGPATNDGR